MPKTPTPSTNCHRRILLLAGLLLLVVPGSATAATYAVDACQHPDGATVAKTGWVAGLTGAFVYVGDNCASGGSIDTAFEPTTAHAFGDTASWTFAAAPGTKLERLTATRSSRSGVSQPFGSPEAFVRTGAGFLERCAVPFACSALDGPIDYALEGQNHLEFGVMCGGAPGGTCPAGNAAMSLRRVRIEMRDDQAPRLTGAPSGTLTSTTNLTRVRDAAYSASDVGGGVYRHRLLADGAEVTTGSVDANGGRCVRYPVGNGFSSPVPCKASVSGSLSYDTAGLPDGAHDLSLQVFDATDENKAEAAWRIQVDNVPPTIGDVGIGGVARVGEVLRCEAAVNGQAAGVAYQWLRAASDGSDAIDIAGATQASYTIVSQDSGKKLLCRMTATDGGGSSVRTSSLTAGSFAGGGVVTAALGVAGAQAGLKTGPAGTSGLPKCLGTTAKMFGAAGSMTRSFGRSRMTLSGRLTPTGGAIGIGGAVLDVMQTVTRAGHPEHKKIATVRTAIDGAFKVKVPRGPTRVVQVVDPGCGSVGPVMTQRVRGTLKARTTTSRVRNKQVARFNGRVLGGYIGRGLPLELQVKVGASWKDVKAVTSDARGRYRVSYRFLRTFVRYTYRFRMVSRGGSAWPYMAARSSTVSVRVN